MEVLSVETWRRKIQMIAQWYGCMWQSQHCVHMLSIKYANKKIAVRFPIVCMGKNKKKDGIMDAYG